jgi:glycosyltransferase involved in cell wall biosynthesis
MNNKCKVLFIINGGRNSIFGNRIKNLSKHFSAINDYKIIYRDRSRKISSIFKFIWHIFAQRPDVVYVEAMAYSGTVASMVMCFFMKFKYILCVSDAYAELVRSNHAKIVWIAAYAFEKICLWSADFILTCNPLHAKWLNTKKLKKNIDHIEHSVDTQLFKPMKNEALRQELRIEDSLIIGLAGSIVWSNRYNFSYGWELVEAMKHLKDINCKAMIVGDGTGIKHLKKLAVEYNIVKKIVFPGFVPHENISDYINCMDICVSTQSNDLVGYLRCPTKLSEYMACGKYIISTDVGYARLYVDKVGELLPYSGIKDDSYPCRLAERIRYLYHHRYLLRKGNHGTSIARSKLEDKVLSKKLESIIMDQIHS